MSGHARLGGIWATGARCLPVKDRAHFKNVWDYVLDHARHGAVTWVSPHVPGMESFDPDSLLLE